MERSSPASTSRALAMARRLRRSGLNTNAVTVLENHVKESPRDERAWAALGVLYDELGQPEKAHAAYELVDEIGAKCRASSPRDKLVASINAQKRLPRRFESTPVSMSDDANAMRGDSALVPQSFGLTKGREILESLRKESANLWEADRVQDMPEPDQSAIARHVRHLEMLRDVGTATFQTASS
ncbi:hypothetical protein NDN08_003793 [Rhodosorus marinus]|uniref:Tetratricopeptide repeat protein n=1 Tax=Rhodosorus marinus TaxID=101924 RepID=A0AAV8UGG7_9RHOD|nr:hypothetical protein NDN08_003793 [Rhodosorus marinus]